MVYTTVIFSFSVKNSILYKSRGKGVRPLSGASPLKLFLVPPEGICNCREIMIVHIGALETL